MNVEEFKTKTQKYIFWVLVLIKDIWVWTIVAWKVVNFANYWAKDCLYKVILMRKKLKWC
jgi:hypothetical protein